MRSSLTNPSPSKSNYVNFLGQLFNVILVKEERPPLQKSAAWLIEPTDRARPPYLCRPVLAMPWAAVAARCLEGNHHHDRRGFGRVIFTPQNSSCWSASTTTTVGSGGRGGEIIASSSESKICRA